MVRLSTLQPAQIAAENWAYPTSLMPRRWTDLNTLKALFYKKAESLGNDGGDAGYAVSHGQLASDEPLYTRLLTGSVLGNTAWSYGNPGIARNSRLPPNLAPSKLIFECRFRFEASSLNGMGMGFVDPSTAGPNSPSASIWCAADAASNFQGRSYNTAAEATDLGVAKDANWHTLQIAIGSAAVTFSIDGNVKATHTTQIPNGGLPSTMDRVSVRINTGEAAAKAARYAYVAVWLE